MAQMLKRRPLISMLGSEDVPTRHERKVRVSKHFFKCFLRCCEVPTSLSKAVSAVVKLPWLYFAAVTRAVHVAEIHPT
jgi:hypothetical protein